MTRLFGTNGIRGVVGQYMTAELAVRVGRAIGSPFGAGSVALARDPRLSGPMLARAVAAGLMSAGIEVIDLGSNVTPDRFVDAVRQHRPSFVGFSALLTTTMPNMKEVIAKFQESGLRGRGKILVGGAPPTLTENSTASACVLRTSQSKRPA